MSNISIKQNSDLEYIHLGRLKLREVIHAGKNPYGIFSHLPYEQRVKMTHEQIKSRKDNCV